MCSALWMGCTAGTHPMCSALTMGIALAVIGVVMLFAMSTPTTGNGASLELVKMSQPTIADIMPHSECAGSPVPISLEGVKGAMGNVAQNAHLVQWWRPWAAPAALPLVALAVQGKANGLLQVVATYANMAMRANVTLFLLSYGDPFDCNAVVAASIAAGGPPHAVCLHAPASTWATGRNALARAIFHAERARGTTFKTWVFADDDAVAEGGLVCANGLGGAETCTGTGFHAWDALVRALVLPLTFPHIYAFVRAVRSPQKSARPACSTCVTRLPVDCGDAMAHAMDRSAVPVLLPYFTDLDSTSWWSSQASMFHVIVGCLGGQGGLLAGFDMVNAAHSTYPRGRPFEAELEVVRRAYPQLADWPLNISHSPRRKFVQGDCAGRGATWRRFDGSSRSDVSDSVKWAASPEFSACYRATIPRFCAFALNVSQPIAQAHAVHTA